MELLRHRSSIIVHYWQGTDHALVKMMMINYDPHIVYEKKIVVLSTKYAGAGCSQDILYYCYHRQTVHHGLNPMYIRGHICCL